MKANVYCNALTCKHNDKVGNDVGECLKELVDLRVISDNEIMLLACATFEPVMMDEATATGVSE